jgi:hypothetical protein
MFQIVINWKSQNWPKKHNENHYWFIRGDIQLKDNDLIQLLLKHLKMAITLTMSLKILARQRYSH